MTYNHREDPAARARWICIKVALSTADFTEKQAALIQKTAQQLIGRKDHTVPILLTTKEEKELEEIQYIAAVGNRKYIAQHERKG